MPGGSHNPAQRTLPAHPGESAACGDGPLTLQPRAEAHIPQRVTGRGPVGPYQTSTGSGTRVLFSLKTWCHAQSPHLQGGAHPPAWPPLLCLWKAVLLPLA